MNGAVFFNWKELAASDLAWVGPVFALVLIVLLANALLRRLLDRVQRRASRTDHSWADAFIESLRTPLRYFVWIVGLFLVLHIVEVQTEAAAVFQRLKPALDLGVITVFTWFLIRLVERVKVRIIDSMAADDKPVDRATADTLAKLVRIAIVVVAVLVGMQTMGFSISAVLAAGGIGGIALGFAGKDLLANFLGGLILFFDHHFAVGDWIRSPDREIEGTVEEIKWRHVRIRTFDKRPLYVPNGLFLKLVIENPSRMTHRRIRETIGIRYKDVGKMDAITTEVRQMLVDHPEIDESQTLMVHFDTFAASSLDFFVYTFTHTTSWTEFHRIKQDVLLRIAAIIESHGAEIAFPTSTLHVSEALGVCPEGPPPST